MCSLRKALRLAGQQMGEWPRKPLFWLALALNLNFTLEPAVALIRETVAALSGGTPIVDKAWYGEKYRLDSPRN